MNWQYPTASFPPSESRSGQAFRQKDPLSGIHVTEEWLCKNCKVIRNSRSMYAFAISTTGERLTKWSSDYIIASKRVLALTRDSSS